MHLINKQIWVHSIDRVKYISIIYTYVPFTVSYKLRLNIFTYCILRGKSALNDPFRQRSRSTLKCEWKLYQIPSDRFFLWYTYVGETVFPDARAKQKKSYENSGKCAYDMNVSRPHNYSLFTVWSNKKGKYCFALNFFSFECPHPKDNNFGWFILNTNRGRCACIFRSSELGRIGMWLHNFNVTAIHFGA